MKRLTHLKRMTQLGSVTLLGLTTMALGACSTTSGTLQAQGAPITYKVNQGSLQQTSATAPYSSILPNTSQSPRAVTPARPLALVRPPERPPVRSALQPQPSMPKLSAELPSANLGLVDKDLYAHQRVGKPYTIMGKRYTPKHQPDYNMVGTASWYGPKFHGKRTANGELYDMNGLTAAHQTLPLNSMVLVTNVQSGKFLTLRVNDRGPFIGDRIIDLSKSAATQLGLFNSGLGKVRVQYAGPADPMASRSSIHHQPPLPQARPEPVPQVVAEIPKYLPLRDLGALQPAPVALLFPQPQVQPRFPFEPKATAPQIPRSQALIPQPTIPQIAPQNAELPGAPSGNVEDGPITLTIKGPVHMASDKNDGTYAKPRFIPAVNYTKLPAGK